MDGETTDLATPSPAPGLVPGLFSWAPPDPFSTPLTHAEIRAIVHGGENDSDACERVLAQADRVSAALEVDIGEGLAALSTGTRLISLGYSCLEDYGREVLSQEVRTSEARAHLARELRTRPLLRAAVRAGEVGLRAAELVLPLAVGEHEAGWVELARRETTRSLERKVEAARAAAGKEAVAEESWLRMRVRLTVDERAVVDQALAVAGRLLPGSTRAQRVEAMAQEYLGWNPLAWTVAENPAARPGRAPSSSFRAAPGADPDRRAREEAEQARLEAETGRWSYLAPVTSLPAPEAGFDTLTSAAEIDARLRALARLRSTWDAHVGWAALMVRQSGLWKLLGFTSFRHYCRERLRLSARTVEERARVEERLWAVPALRRARAEGLSYDKVRRLSRLRDPRRIAAWIPWAFGLTCVGLQRALDAEEEGQMRAQGFLRAKVPAGAADVLAWAFRTVRAHRGALLDDARCLVFLAEHFVETWQDDPRVRRSLSRSQKIRARDLGCCQAPGCSRRGVHAHHVVFEGRGGGHAEVNLVSLCAFHHLVGIHEGFMTVRGLAPDRLVWTAGGRPFRAGAQEPPGEELEAGHRRAPCPLPSPIRMC